MSLYSAAADSLIRPTKEGAMANGLCDGGQHQDVESDADEEVRSLDLPAQVGIDLRNKRSNGRDADGAECIERERPMSWEGELSDQEIDDVRLKTEPIPHDEDMSMEGIQSVGPSSPQPMCTDLVKDGAESEMRMPAESADASAGSIRQDDMIPSALIKSEVPWELPGVKNGASAPESGIRETANGDPRIRRSPPPPLTQRPTFGESLTGHTPLASPLTSRHPIRLPLGPSGLPHPPTPSPDSAIHSAYYSPTASPGQSRHRSGSGLSSPYSHRASPSLSRNNSDASQYSQYGGSQYSYSSAPSPLSPSPAQSPVQPRHVAMLAAGFAGSRPGGLGLSGSEFPPSPLLYRHGTSGQGGHHPFPGATPAGSLPGVRDLESIKRENELLPPMAPALSQHSASAIDTTDDSREGSSEEKSLNPADLAQHTALAAQAGISRQQLINSPCPICGDKISGFHYGIFSCESCKGFFKRTVQNKKNYVCLRGAACPVTIATRKKCPACRFEKCLNTGMKLEAIREDRTRGGRSTYQCTYALPGGGSAPSGGSENSNSSKLMLLQDSGSRSMETAEWAMGHASSSSSSTPPSSGLPVGMTASGSSSGVPAPGDSAVPVPPLLLEIMNVEHLWHTNEQEGQQHRRGSSAHLAATNGAADGDYLTSLCSIADHRLYKIVKWCKSLPLFKNIQIDDQISLLINTWCELLLFACCYRSVAAPGEVRISHGKSITLEQARVLGLAPCIERMIHFTDHLRRLRVDQYEYAAMKVIILLSSDTSGLKERESVRTSQESVLKALQQYTLSHYPDVPSKFGELLLRIPELERICQVSKVGKDMLTVKREGDGQGFNLLMELLRGDH